MTNPELRVVVLDKQQCCLKWFVSVSIAYR